MPAFFPHLFNLPKYYFFMGMHFRCLTFLYFISRYINELIECIILAYNNEGFRDASTDQSPNVGGQNHEPKKPGEHGRSSESNLRKDTPSINQETDFSLTHLNRKRVLDSGSSEGLSSSMMQDEPIYTRNAEWAKVFDAATQRRTEVLMPENLENMWAIGRNYKKKIPKRTAAGIQASEVTDSVSGTFPPQNLVTELPKLRPVMYPRIEDKDYMKLPPRPLKETRPTDLSLDALSSSEEFNMEHPKGSAVIHLVEDPAVFSRESRNKLKRSNSTSDLKFHVKLEDMFDGKDSAPIINEYYSADANKLNVRSLMSSSDTALRREGLHVRKLRCRV